MPINALRVELRCLRISFEESAPSRLFRRDCFEEVAPRRLLQGGCFEETASRRLLPRNCSEEAVARRMVRGGVFEEAAALLQYPLGPPNAQPTANKSRANRVPYFVFFFQPTRPLSDPPSIMPYETFPTDLVDTSGKVVARCWQVWSTSLKVSCKVKGHNRSEFIVRSNWFDSSDAAFACLLSWASRGHILDDVRTPFRGDHERQCNETR